MNSNFFNLSKRKKRDLLFELLMGRTTEGIISKKEINAVNRLLVCPPSEKTPVKKARSARSVEIAADGKKTGSKRKKITCYLTQEIVENLDKVKTAVHFLGSGNIRSRVSRSFIVNLALGMTLQEFAANGRNSRLMRFIQRQIEND